MKILKSTSFQSVAGSFLFEDLLLHCVCRERDSALVMINPDIEHKYEKTTDGYEEMFTIRLPGEAGGSLTREFDLGSNSIHEVRVDGKSYRITLKEIQSVKLNGRESFFPKFEVAELG